MRKIKKKALATSLLVCCFFHSPLWGGSVYYTALDGHNANPGTEALPFRSVSRGVASLFAGDTLLVKSGTYFERIDSNATSIPSGTSWDDAPLIKVYPGDAVTLSSFGGGQGAVINMANSSLNPSIQYLVWDGFIVDAFDEAYGVSTTNGANHIRFQNMEIKNAAASGVLITPGSQSAPYNTFQEFINTDVHDNGSSSLDHGLYLATSSNLVAKSRIHDNASFGVQVFTSAPGKRTSNNVISGNEVYDNNVHANTSAGILLSTGDGNKAFNNVVYRNGVGIQIHNNNPTNSEVYNNTVYDNEFSGINITSLSEGAIVKNNIVFQNGIFGVTDNGSASTVLNNLTIWPSFVDIANGDFHLQSGSIAIDIGTTLSEVTTDFDGNPRPQGAGYDIGAFEFVPATNADFNGDGNVDGSDLLDWQRGFGVGTTLQEGDANGDSTVDDADLAIWGNQFASAAALAGSATVVPEPASLALVGIVLALSATGRSPVRKSKTGRQKVVLCGQKVPLVMLATMTLCINAATCCAHPDDVDSLPNYVAAVTQESDQQEEKSTEQLEKTMTPLLRTVDLKLGESQWVELCDGKKVTVKLLDLKETRDTVRDAIRDAQVSVEIDGKPVTLKSGNYHLPVTIAGVQIDCPITHGYYSNTTQDHWMLNKDARLRLWPADSPLVHPGTFGYPVKQRWFASHTWMSNQPVEGGYNFSKTIYYHDALDFGGTEGMVEVIAATDGLVVSSGEEVLDGLKLEDTPIKPRYDNVNIKDGRGWYYRYSHLKEIDKNIKPGKTIRRGDRIGVLGKEGSGGGWSHLHFGIWSRQPSGKWGIQDGYAFVWEAYLRQYQPKLIANARPYHLNRVGEKVVLDGSRSWSAGDKIASYEWIHDDGSTQQGVRVQQTYDRPGVYSEILKITDPEGRVDYDTTTVMVIDNREPGRCPPYILPNYAPTFGIRAGDPVTFKVRSYYFTAGHEIWDFGDGSPHVEVQSEGNDDQHAKHGYAVTTHRFSKPGHYIVRVERSDGNGARAVGHLHVRVGLANSE